MSRINIKCLILTPFSDQAIKRKETLKKKLSELGVTVTHGADLSLDKPLLEGMSELLDEADLVIADISELNPNIMYEIGLAQGAKLPVIFIASNETEIPMSLARINMIRFEEKENCYPKLASEVVAILKETGKLPRSLIERRKPIAPKDSSSIIRVNPFDYLNAESIYPDETLAALFVAPPYFNSILDHFPVVLIGPRGCGKTMILRMIRSHLHRYLSIENTANQYKVAGFYVNFNTAFRFLGAETAVLSNNRTMITYLNILFLQDFTNEIDVLYKSGKISHGEMHEIVSVVTKRIGIAQEDMSSIEILLSEIVGWKDIARSGSQLEEKIGLNLSSDLFLKDFAADLCNNTSLFSDLKIAFLLDDYASDWLPKDICRSLNRIFFLRSPFYSFKISTIPGRQSYSIDELVPLEPTRDYLLVNMVPDVSFHTARSHTRFLEEIIDRRLSLANSAVGSKSLFGKKSAASTTADYSGIEGLSRLCTGDYGTIISICRKIVEGQSLLGTSFPISKQSQNKFIRASSHELINFLAAGLEWGQYVFDFTQRLMSFMRIQFLNTKESGEPVIYSSLIVEASGSFSTETEEKILWLIRSGVLQPSTSSHGRHKFIIRRMLFPAFGLPVYKLNCFLLVSLREAEFMFCDPKGYWQYMTAKVKRS